MLGDIKDTIETHSPSLQQQDNATTAIVIVDEDSGESVKSSKQQLPQQNQQSVGENVNLSKQQPQQKQQKRITEVSMCGCLLLVCGLIFGGVGGAFTVRTNQQLRNQTKKHTQLLKVAPFKNR